MMKYYLQKIKKTASVLVAVALVAALTAAMVLYHKGYYDISFIERPSGSSKPNPDIGEAATGEIFDPWAQTHPGSTDEKETSETAGNDNSTATVLGVFDSASFADSPASFKTTVRMEQEGYGNAKSGEDYTSENSILAKMTFRFSLPSKFSLSTRTEKDGEVVIPADGSEIYVRYTDVVRDRPAIEVYMGYILVDIGEYIAVLSEDGEPLCKYSYGKYEPAYTRDRDGKPLFKKISDSGETLYFYISENGKNFVGSTFNPKTDGRGLYFDYAPDYGLSDGSDGSDAVIAIGMSIPSVIRRENKNNTEGVITSRDTLEILETAEASDSENPEDTAEASESAETESFEDTTNREQEETDTSDTSEVSDATDETESGSESDTDEESDYNDSEDPDGTDESQDEDDTEESSGDVESEAEINGESESPAEEYEDGEDNGESVESESESEETEESEEIEIETTAPKPLYGYVVKNAAGQVTYNLTGFKYAEAYPFSEGFAAVREDGGRRGMFFIGKYGYKAFEPQKSYVNEYGRYAEDILIPPLTNGIESIGSFYFEFGLVRARRQSIDYWNYYSRNTLKIIKEEEILLRTDGSEYDLPNGYILEGYSDGMILLSKGEGEEKRYGFMSYIGEWIAQPIYKDATPFIGGLATLTLADGRVGMIDTYGEIILPFTYDSITQLSGNVIAAYRKENGWTVFKHMIKEASEESGETEEGTISEAVSG